MADLTYTDHGSIILITPRSAVAREWVAAHVAVEQTWGGAIVTEPRYAYDLLTSAGAAGLTVSSDEQADATR